MMPHLFISTKSYSGNGSGEGEPRIQYLSLLASQSFSWPNLWNAGSISSAFSVVSL